MPAAAATTTPPRGRASLVAHTHRPTVVAATAAATAVAPTAAATTAAATAASTAPAPHPPVAAPIAREGATAAATPTRRGQRGRRRRRRRRGLRRGEARRWGARRRCATVSTTTNASDADSCVGQAHVRNGSRRAAVCYNSRRAIPYISQPCSCAVVVTRVRRKGGSTRDSSLLVTTTSLGWDSKNCVERRAPAPSSVRCLLEKHTNST